MSKRAGKAWAVVYRDGTYVIVKDERQAREFENDPDWLVTIATPFEDDKEGA